MGKLALGALGKSKLFNRITLNHKLGVLLSAMQETGRNVVAPSPIHTGMAKKKARLHCICIPCQCQNKTILIAEAVQCKLL